MNTGTIDDGAQILFETPGGELRFGEGDLDRWAEHLEWCYRLLGVDQGVTIAVQDFGTSPLAYLGSSLLMPTLNAGIAERLDAKVICLDASNERVALTPEVIRQVSPDVLVVRADVFGLLLEGSSRRGVDLTAVPGLSMIVAVGCDNVPLPPGTWRRLLNIESAMLLAPECAHCGSFHLHDGVYSVEGDTIHNKLHAGVADYPLGRLRVIDDRCERGPNDLLCRIGGDERGV